MRPDPIQPDVLDYVLDDMDATRRAAFEERLAADAGLRCEVDRLRALTVRLRKDRDEACEDLVPAVLKRLDESMVSVWPLAPQPWLRRAAIALVFLGLLSALALKFALARPPAEVQAAHRGLDWLLTHQQPDGSWKSVEQSGSCIGTTGVSLLALTRSGDSSHREAVNRGIQFLLDHQRPDGRFCEQFREGLYHHGLATLALLEAYDRNRENALREPLRQALDFLQARQDRRAGWGYGPGVERDPRAWIWPALALQKARDQGWPVPSAVELPEVELARINPETAPDFQAWFWACRLDPRREDLPVMKQQLVQAQETGGPGSGSWAPSGGSAQPGARIYSTALAALLLQS